jgi:hypothetical protein
MLYLEYYLEKVKPVMIILYDLGGKEMATILPGRKQIGQQKVTFNMGGLPWGMYIIKVKIGDRTSSRILHYVR